MCNSRSPNWRNIQIYLKQGGFFFSPGKVNGVCVGSTEIESHLQVTKIVVFTLLV